MSGFQCVALLSGGTRSSAVATRALQTLVDFVSLPLVTLPAVLMVLLTIPLELENFITGGSGLVV